MLCLSACGAVISDPSHIACPPVIEYSRAEQMQLADELAALPEHARILDWMADYAVLRDQARACAARADGSRRPAGKS